MQAQVCAWSFGSFMAPQRDPNSIVFTKGMIFIFENCISLKLPYELKKFQSTGHLYRAESYN